MSMHKYFICAIFKVYILYIIFFYVKFDVFLAFHNIFINNSYTNKWT